jgi:hypothetical protein
MLVCPRGNVPVQLRGSPSGVQPVRMCKLDGEPSTLLAVGSYSDMDSEAWAINQSAGVQFRYAHTARENWGCKPPVKMRKATASQIQRWPELAAYRPPESLITLGEPYLLWKQPPHSH